MSRHGDLLFYEGDLYGTLDNHSNQITNEVNAIPKDQFLAIPEEDLVEHIFSQLRIEPIILYEDRMQMEQHEIEVDVSGYSDRFTSGDGPCYVHGISVSISIPYTGESLLWKLRPSSYQSVFPRAKVHEKHGDTSGELSLVFKQPADEDQQRIKDELEQQLRSIRFYVDAQKSQIESFNNTAPDLIRRAVQSRRERLKKQDGISDLLGIPIKQKDGAPSIEPIQVKKAITKPLPPAPDSGYKPEPGITDTDYEYILSVIRHEGRTFETTPGTYFIHDEEELRDIILAHLNGHFQGGATGETFRRSGKTDIRIEDQERAAFVAECKIWRGQKELNAAVDQLLSYLTWRDCKASIIIFNKHNAKFTELLEKIPESLVSHPNFKREIEHNEDGEWRFVFTSKEDELRQVIINAFAFNIYIEKD